MNEVLVKGNKHQVRTGHAPTKNTKSGVSQIPGQLSTVTTSPIKAYFILSYYYSHSLPASIPAFTY